MLDTQKKPHILVASVPIFGHVEKMRVIAAGLVERGFPVTFLTGTVFREFVQDAGAHFEPLEGKCDFDGGKLAELWPERAKLPPGPAQLEHDLTQIFLVMIPSQYESLQRVLKRGAGPDGREEYRVLVQDSLFLGVFPVLHGAPGIRPTGVITIGITPVIVSSKDHAPFSLGLPPDSSEEGRARNIAGNAQMQKAFEPVQNCYTRSLKSAGATKAPTFMMDSVVESPDQFLQLCISNIEYPRSDAPESLRYIGALPLGKHKSHPLPPWWDIVIKHERPIVVVSQGTASFDLNLLVVPTLEALKDLDVTVISTLVLADHLEGVEIPANAKVAKFIPFDELFKHVDVVVSNGGYGTIQQALGNGVPMVLAGMTEDKPEANARTAWTGAAINLATNQPKPSQIREAVEKVLKTSTYRARALELQVEYLRHDSLGEIAASCIELASLGRGIEDQNQLERPQRRSEEILQSNL
ncbi:MAG: hypothetical protein M1827_000385 [Pycnora praestabilis]|nr:MAG: hypothetical protein M1827_000385 [Pycnora praestabilis]